MLLALSAVFAALTFCPKPADAGILVASENLSFIVGYYWDQADTPITHILTGIAGSGCAATGAIGSARRDLGHSSSRFPKSEPRTTNSRSHCRVGKLGAKSRS
jgi:hypothetical protein